MLWVTLKDGEIRRYNEATVYLFDAGWARIARGEPIEKHVIAWIREDMIESLEFERPCEITFQANALDSALDIVLKRLRKAHGPQLDKLASLKRSLADFNPQRKQWSR